MSDVLVTGATRGIGRAVLEAIVGSQRVVAVYRSAQAAADAVAQQHGDRVSLVRAELSDDAGIASVVDAVKRPLAGVVLAAGTSAHAPLTATDVLDTALRDNLRAPLALIAALVRGERLAEGCSIVLIGSNLARHGLAGAVAYSAAKAGLEGATRALARELAATKVRVNAVAPGLLRTDMTAHRDPAELAAYATTVPLLRLGDAGDVAPLVAFLLGSGAAYITGQTIDVDGGWGC